MRAGRLLTLGIACLLALWCARLSFGHIRLSNPGNGSELYWSNANSIGIVVQSSGSDDIDDGTDLAALRAAISAWNVGSGSAAQLIEDASPAQMARTDWAADSIHLLMFDETNNSEYFPSGSKTVALTPIWFTSGGQITDADVLFNGKGYRFTTTGELGSFDITDVATHELGHLLGLDHSGNVGASLYPYVSPSVILHRSPSEDDLAGLRHAYPGGSEARIRGRVARLSGGSGVAGALVVARGADGRCLASDLASSGGSFELNGLLPGSYTLYASPLDEPVGAGNLTSGQPVESDFEPAFHGSPVLVDANDDVNIGDLLVGADVALNLGRSIDPLPLRVVAGETRSLTLRGSGLVVGSSMSASDADFAVAPSAWLGSMVTFRVTVPAHEAPGHADLEVIGPGGELAILPGALEITPPAPSVSLVLPNTGSSAGGASITIFGTDFRAGARVVIGDQIYVDGQAGGATVVGPTSIQLTTRAGLHGLHDVVVIDATGVEGRQVDGFLVSSQPVVDTIFPAAGDASGGTELVLRGGSFEGGLEVRIDGELQSAVTVDGATRAHVTTKGGLPGGPYSVQVQNPGGGIATSAFVYVGQADPVLAAVVPASGAASGGEELVLSGSNFTANSSVVFGADPDTGLGGAQASVVEFVDASTLRVTTPPHASGSVSVMVRDDSTEQASLLPQSFSFSGAAQGSGGGGCHAGLASGGPTRLVDVVGGSWWILLALGALQLDTLRRRRQLARV